MQTVFLNADVGEDLFANKAPGNETNDKAGVPLVMKLKKAVYGLRQSPKNSFGTMDLELAAIGFLPLKSDPCVYIYDDKTSVVTLTLYVDDFLSLSANKTLLNKLNKIMKQLMDRFEVFDMGDVSRILGMTVTRDGEKGAITIGQKD